MCIKHILSTHTIKTAASLLTGSFLDSVTKYKATSGLSVQSISLVAKP